MESVTVRLAAGGDVAALAALRAAWAEADEPGFGARMAEWLESEGPRRTTWLAERDGEAIGLASMLEYRRMPKPGRGESRWGYVSNMFVREDARDRGVGSQLLAAVIAAAEERDYVRLVLSPTERAVPFYARAGFVAPGGDDDLLVRPRR